jgi:hypothetical protein
VKSFGWFESTRLLKAAGPYLHARNDPFGVSKTCFAQTNTYQASPQLTAVYLHSVMAM